MDWRDRVVMSMRGNTKVVPKSCTYNVGLKGLKALKINFSQVLQEALL